MIKKAVLPVAGFGTRCLPASKAIPKEMITIVDKPVIQYVVEEAIQAGIKEIILITHSAKVSIENHFDKHFELETQLEAKGKWELLYELRHILPDDVSIISIRQPEARGLGHAIACARPIIDNEPFVVMLPDVLIQHNKNHEKNDLLQMIQSYELKQHPQIMVHEVPNAEVNKYGIVGLKKSIAPGQSCELSDLVEKPNVEKAPSNLAIVGRYILPPTIFNFIDKTLAGADGEIQLTDAINALRKEVTVEAYRMRDTAFDCGSKIGYLEAILAYATQHPQLSERFKTIAQRYIND